MSPKQADRHIVIFGGDGDLSMRKLLPALYRLDMGGFLAEEVTITGVGRHTYSDEEFKTRVSAKLDEFVGKDNLEADILERFMARIQFATVDGQKRGTFKNLKERITFDGKLGKVLYYLAMPPHLYVDTCGNLSTSGMVDRYSLVVLEKPIGESLDSAQEINRKISNFFPENNIFRIDHYLGKEAVQNLLSLRFANVFFEQIWNHTHVDHVQITVAETVGVEGRWQYYDRAGALKDMVQNHLLQLLTLVAMDPPPRFDPDCVRAEKLKVLSSLRPIDASNVEDMTVRGQYVAGKIDDKKLPAYAMESEGQEMSTTETYVALKMFIDTWCWSGVPFYMRTGKRMKQRYSEVVVQFKPVAHDIFGGESVPNQLVIRLQPDDSIELVMMNKVPGLSRTIDLKPVSLNLSMAEQFEGAYVPEAYERLLLDAINGDGTLFMSRQEVEEAWQWIDGIIGAWKEAEAPLEYYASGSNGPKASAEMLEELGHKWYKKDEG